MDNLQIIQALSTEASIMMNEHAYITNKPSTWLHQISAEVAMNSQHTETQRWGMGSLAALGADTNATNSEGAGVWPKGAANMVADMVML